MLCEEDIKSIVYKVVKGSDLANEVDGVVTKLNRPLNSSKEDIVISVLTSGSIGKYQHCVVNLNIYVPDIKEDGQYEPDTARLEKLEKMAFALFKECQGRYDDEDYKITADKQHTEKVNGKDEHFINTQLDFNNTNY
ncbi:MAG: hypothetical protein LKK08_06325 [Bacteroidales bacterium]|jgi:hypothetical protein|nr:hypothetical protein [Bacteroidales bacterium]